MRLAVAGDGIDHEVLAHPGHRVHLQLPGRAGVGIAGFGFGFFHIGKNLFATHQVALAGLGQGDATINLDIDRDKVRAYGLTVAQVYQQIAAKLTTTTTAETPVTVDGSTMKVQISDNLDPMTKENMMDMTFTTSVMDATGTTTTGTCTLGDIASWTTGTAPDSITSENQTRYITVSADTLDGYNTTVQSRVLQKALNEFAAGSEMPEGCNFSMGGETENVDFMVREMVQWMALALPFVYLVMVAQFQSLLSPFIVLFTVPLAFTGGLIGLLRNGDMIEYSIPDRTLNACLSEEEIARRRADWKPTYNKVSSSWLSRYRKLATNASRGAVLQSGE